MRYVLLLYANEALAESCPAAEVETHAHERDAFVRALDLGGARREAHRLTPSAMATTVRMRGGRSLISDGPATEMREQLQALVLVEASDLDEVIAIARRAPHARTGSVEIRPLQGST